MIHLILGCMWSGKSTELFRRLRRAEHAGMQTRLYKYARDNRYVGRQELAASHDGLQRQAIPVEFLDPKEIVPGSVIGIDEGQFIDNLMPFCEEAARQGCTVIVAALDSDFLRNCFPRIQELLPKCEHIDKLHAVCFICKGEASFTQRIDKKKRSVEDIGGDEKYRAVCRNCFHL